MRLNSIHEISLNFVKYSNAEQQQHTHKCKTITQGEPRKVALPQRGEAEGLDDRGHRVSLDKRTQRPRRHHAERINDWRSIHPELDDEGKQDREVAVLGRQ